MVNIIKQKHKIIAVLLLLVMLIGLIPFTATEVHAVEVDATAEGTEPFTGDFTLELWNTEDTSKHETHQMTHNGTDWNVAKTDILPAKAFAYAGNGVTVTSPDNYSVELTADQSTEDAFNGADVMIATGEATEDTTLDLNFEHYFAKVTFNVYLDGEFQKGTELTPITDLYVMTKDNSVPEVTAYCSGPNSNASYHYYCSAYIPAGTYKVGDTFVKIDIGEYTGDKRLEAKMSEDNYLTLTAGTHYTYYLKVGKDKSELYFDKASADIFGGWNNETDLNNDSDIGGDDTGKSAWVVGDEILVLFDTEYYGKQVTTLTYAEDDYGLFWSINQSEPFHRLSSATGYTIKAWYAPCYTLNAEGSLVLKSDKMAGTDEIIQTTAVDINLGGSKITIDFSEVTRNYSRLRIAGAPGNVYTVTTTGFTPAGATTAGEYTYTLTADSNGNAYLYGTFAKDATVTVKQGDVVQAEYTFSAENGFSNGTVAGMSYALDARVAQVTEEYIDALVETLKTNAASGTPTVITGNAMITVDGENKTAIGEAIYRLSEDENYYGKIDLILQDATEIIDQEFAFACALNSITLPKVTKLGNEAFACCEYLTKITFGSVVTEGIEYSFEVFRDVGYAVGGCDLFLNCEQENAEYDYQPYIDVDNTYWWWETEWKSFTLTHSGENSECNECKANQ